MTSSYTFPEVECHGEIEEVFPNIYTVKGAIGMSMLPCLKATFSRNMTIIKQGQDLILMNSIRLDKNGLKELDKLGSVKHVIRLASFHGKDDAFYKDRYGAKVWAVKETTYFAKFDYKSEPYFTPDEFMTSSTKLPIDGSSLTVIESKPPQDAVLLLERPEGKILVCGDSLQNWETTDSYFNCLGSTMMRSMGFIKPCNVGPAWAQTVKVEMSEMKKLLQLEFDHVLPCHGTPVIGQAWKKYEPSVNAMK